MKEIQYKTFSWNTHQKNWRIKRPNVCQFELTFRCGLACNYCYASCYNNPAYIKGELDTVQVKSILNQLYDAGVIWLCFTGGDPLERDDFLEIYAYAKDRGFIVTIFTNAYSMTEEIADYLKKSPAFVIEITLNGVSRETYEKISNVKGSFARTMKGLNLILERKLPLKIKTEITKDNLWELPKIKEFVERLGIEFRPDPMLRARLDGDLIPCSLRISPEEVLRLDKGFNFDSMEEECKLTNEQINRPREENSYLFRCAIGGGDGVYIDPWGNLIPCISIRSPKINLLEKGIQEAQREILNWVRSRTVSTDSRCRDCPIRDLCYNCPGNALLEKGSLEGKVDWFCALAHLTERRLSVKELNTKGKI